MHFNADHTKFFVACGDNDVIDVLDVASGKVVGKLVTGSSPEPSPWMKRGGASASPMRRLRHSRYGQEDY
jgi:hypothetical protein